MVWIGCHSEHTLLQCDVHSNSAVQTTKGRTNILRLLGYRTNIRLFGYSVDPYTQHTIMGTECKHLIINFTTDMEHYFKDLSVCNTHQHIPTGRIVCEWWHPDPLQKLGIWCPSELHQEIRHPLQTLGIWCLNELHGVIRHPLLTLGILCPSELHRGMWHPLQTLGIWCPSELHWGIRHPLQTLGIWCLNELHWEIRHPLQTLGIWCPSELHGEFSIPCKH